MKNTFISLLKSLYIVFDSLILITSKLFIGKKSSGKYLLINMGGLGDSIVFLSMINSYQSKMQDKDHISIIINKKYKQIFSFCDDKYFSIYEIDVDRYRMNLFYRLYTNLYFSRFNYDFVANVRGGRTGIYEDSLIRLIKGRKIGLADDKNYSVSGTTKLMSFFVDNFVYDHTIKFDYQNIIHEMLRIKILLDFIFKMKNNLDNIFLDKFFKKINQKKIINDKYFVMNIGAGKKFRKWKIKYFIELSKMVSDKFDLIPVFCGTEEDNRALIQYEQYLTNNTINLCGKASIHELLNILYHSELCISNDSGPANISYLMKTKSICVKNHFGENRFFPYPKNLLFNEEITISKQYIQEIEPREVFEKVCTIYN